MTLHLNKIYKKIKDGQNQIELFNGLDIKFPSKGLFAITGSSGCGKSTLLHIIGGLVEQDQGSVLYNDLECFYNIKEKNKYIKENISFIFQGNNLIKSLTVKENLQFGQYCKSQKFNNEEKLIQYVNKFELNEHIHKYPSELSGGQQQRVGLIRALICDTPILLCDEPTGSLHKHQAKKVMEILKLYSKNHLVIIVSHDIELVSKYTNSIIDFNNIENKYDFSKEIYPHYYKKKLSNINIKYAITFSIKQLIHSKKMYISLFIFQILTILSFLLLYGSCIGLSYYYDSLASKDVSVNQILIKNNDINNTSFSEKQLLQLNNEYQVHDYYDLELGILVDVNTNFSYIPSNIEHVVLIDGELPKVQNEIAVNQILSIEGYNIGDYLEYCIDDYQYRFLITAIIDDEFLDYPLVYFDEFTLDTNLKKLILNNDVKIIEIDRDESVSEIIDILDVNYHTLSFNLETRNSHESMVNMVGIVGGVFVLISFFISLVLIVVVFSTLLIKRRKDNAIALSFGQSITNFKIGYLIEGGILGFIFINSGIVFGTILIFIFNSFNIVGLVSSYNFNIKLLNFEIFVFINAVYILTCSLLSYNNAKTISTHDLSMILKEES